MTPPDERLPMAETDYSATTYSVDRGAWSHLSAEEAVLVAPPITVSSRPAGPQPDAAALEAVERGAEALRRAQQARSQANMPVGRHTRPTR